MDVKVQRDTKVTISLSEEEAGKLMSVLWDIVDFEPETWAEELHDSLRENEVLKVPYRAIAP